MEIVKSWFEKGYNSHGCITTFGEIVEDEIDRDNEPFINYDKALVEKISNIPAIWVTTEPYSAFIYNLDAEEYNEDPESIKNRIPDWQDSLTVYDTTDAYILKDTDDGDFGYVMLLGPEERFLNAFD